MPRFNVTWEAYEAPFPGAHPSECKWCSRKHSNLSQEKADLVLSEVKTRLGIRNVRCSPEKSP